MANYCGYIRTNYFRVNDEKRFRQIIADCSAQDDIDIFEKDGESNLFGFGLYGCIYGLRPEGQEDSELDEDIDLFFQALQEVLADGEAILFTEVGYEKLRYLIAYTVIVTKTAIETVDLRSEAFKKAGELLGVERYDTEDQY